MRYYKLNTYIIFSFVLFITGCSKTLYDDFSLDQLIINKSEYNGYIINRGDGLHRLKGFTIADSSYGIIAVHGYYPMTWPTKGFEWVLPLKKLSDFQIPIWFLKYNWFECPDISVDYLNTQIEKLLDDSPHIDSLWVIGHSLGGYITTNFSEKWQKPIPITIHSIAAPLKGSIRKESDCLINEKSEYIINPSVRYTQWRTDHTSDGAFKNMEYDPQDVMITNGAIVKMPKNWKNKRLGHNRSIQYVIDQLLQ